jgi:hypothetical protein
MFVQRALRTGLVLVLMGGLASGPLAVFSTARSQITQETAIGPDAADALAQMGKQSWTFRSYAGPNGELLHIGDNQMIFESVARLNAVEPSKFGQSDSWSNPETKSSGTSTILRMFRSGGMACHLVRHHIVAGRPPPRDYRLTWCHTSNGEWKIKS